MATGDLMSRTLASQRHRGVWELLVQRRKAAGLTQAEVAKRLGRYQSFVATVESGQRRVDVVEFIAFAEAIGFDPLAAVSEIAALPDDCGDHDRLALE